MANAFLNGQEYQRLIDPDVVFPGNRRGSGQRLGLHPWRFICLVACRNVKSLTIGLTLSIGQAALPLKLVGIMLIKAMSVKVNRHW